MDPKMLGNDWEVLSKLGEGSFSEVFKARSEKNQKCYAIKILKKRYHSVGEINQLEEVKVLRTLKGCANIVNLEEVLFDSQHFCLALVFELLDMNLYELSNARQFDEQSCLLIVYQLLKAIKDIHEKNVFHRDIKPENCMINEKTLELKLADFGSTRKMNDGGPYTEYVATRWYRAPECILTNGNYGPAVDMWAVGCILFELITKYPLFPGSSQIDQIAKIHNILGTPCSEAINSYQKNPNMQVNYSFPQRNAQDFTNLLPNSSPDVIELFSRLITYNPESRISAKDALQHPAFKTIRRIENKYLSSSYDIPFSSFFLSNTVQQQINQQNLQQNDLSLLLLPNSEMPPITLISNTIFAQKEQPKLNKVVAPSNLEESRKAAIQRLRQYKDPYSNMNIKPPQKLPFQRHALHFGIAKVTKNTLPTLTINPYQKPSADLIKPHIQIKY